MKVNKTDSKTIRIVGYFDIFIRFIMNCQFLLKLFFLNLFKEVLVYFMRIFYWKINRFRLIIVFSIELNVYKSFSILLVSIPSSSPSINLIWLLFISDNCPSKLIGCLVGWKMVTELFWIYCCWHNYNFRLFFSFVIQYFF